MIADEIRKEEEKFLKTLSAGLKEFDKVVSRLNGNIIDGKTAFRLYDTFGFPIEITEELAKDKGIAVDAAGFHEAFAEHQKKSQAGAEQKFKGGLIDQSEDTSKLHTATHLLGAALKAVLGDSVSQRGSNITPERLRFDFNFERPMTEDEIAAAQALVNGYIAKNVPITCKEMPTDKAKEAGAVGVFDGRYGDVVKVYGAGDFSLEICGGPHAKTTGELGKFVIQKEQSSSAGVRRIKAVLE
jgi:alanyl-tRNA synthetase